MKPKAKANTKQRRRLAARLAGQTVVWLVSGRGMDYAHHQLNLAPQNEQTPVEWSYVFAFYTPQQARALAVSILAGFLAEQELDPSAPRQDVAADRRQVHKLVRKFTLPEVRELEIEAGDLVRRFMDIILRFTGELLQRETIPGATCEDIFEQLSKSVLTD
jgi:hypothetical protein